MRVVSATFAFLALVAFARTAPQFDDENCPGWCIICQSLDPETPGDSYLCGCKMAIARCSPKPPPPAEVCASDYMKCEDGTEFTGCAAATHMCIENVRESHFRPFAGTITCLLIALGFSNTGDGGMSVGLSLSCLSICSHEDTPFICTTCSPGLDHTYMCRVIRTRHSP